MSQIPAAKIRTDFPANTVEAGRTNRDGHDFPLSFAKILRVDPRKRVVDLITVVGQSVVYRDVLIPFPGAGARSFLGAMPEVADVCVIGYTYEESGKSRQPLIISWVTPNVSMGYDWVMSQFMAQSDLAMTPETQEALKGIVGRRRHKSQLLESGNVGASSAQGSDLILDESVSLANRRGNELVLRDQDQALVVRTLQQFHVGAGFRVYGGMVQRDGASLSSQMLSDGTDWASDRQVDADGLALAPEQLKSSETNTGALTANPVFSNSLVIPIDPLDILKRGLLIDSEGSAYDDLVTPELVYGGKSISRVNMVKNGLDTGLAFTEYRIEVTHTSDGTLPVSEQTDGVDIDRLLPAVPVDGIGEMDPSNRSANAMMVEFVLGTAIGNDPTGDRGSYGKPLKPQLYTKDGQMAPGIIMAEDDDPVTDHAAFLVRVRNPVDMKAPDAFMAITKGGSLISYFPGQVHHQEFYGSGRNMRIASGLNLQSLELIGDGSLTLKNEGTPRVTDNVGIELVSNAGAVVLSGGASRTGDGVVLDAVVLDSGTGVRVSGSTRVKIAAPNVAITEANTISVNANSALTLASGDGMNISTASLNVSVSAKADYIFGGPKNALATNGPSRSTVFAANPATGATGGTVDSYLMAYGGLHETFLIGRRDTDIAIGSFNVSTADPIGQSGTPSTPGDGINLSAGPTMLDQSLELKSPLTGGGASLQANLGSVTMRATKGKAVIQGTVGIAMQSAGSVTVTAPTMTVRVPTTSPGRVLTDGVIDSFTGRPFVASGTVGVATFRVGV